MDSTPRLYLLSPSAGWAATSATIQTCLRCVRESSVDSRARYFDSFDWRLYHAGAALEQRIDQAGSELRWLDLDHNAVVVACQRMAADPGFADTLPKGPLCERLAPVLGIRRLLPVAEVGIRRQTLGVLNGDDKTVVRIVLEKLRPVDPDRPISLALPMRLRLQPVRGYDRELAAVADELGRRLEFSLTDPADFAALLRELLASTGRRPGAYSSKLAYRLDPAQRADAAAKEILRGLWDTLEANVDGTIRNLDTEFLHDLRVATRRTRSALSQIPGVFPESIVGDFKGRFAWLQRVTGPVRDLDVHLLDFPILRNGLPERMREGLAPLRDRLGSHYAVEHRRLAEALESRRFQDLRRDWRAFLHAPVPALASADLGNAGRPVKSVADRRILRMLKRVRRQGRKITDVSPAEDLHALRKDCKKLRYLMEFFGSLYPADDLREPIKQSKALLDNLGSFQDLEVQAEHLMDTARLMHADGTAEVATLLSMGALIQRMLARQQRARKAFADTFAEFDHGIETLKRLITDASVAGATGQQPGQAPHADEDPSRL